MLSTALVLFVAAAPAKSQALLDKGKAAFQINCVACHGEKGAGDGPGAAALNPKPRNYAKDPFKQGDKLEDIFATLTKGVPGTPMVAFAHLAEEDRWALAYWVLELKGAGNDKPAVLDAGTKTPPKKK
ncbi:MAG: cytochrome c [Archangiaceae bacterium]|nr:cytochrome c [Archangiaceae bacterium]